MIKQGSEMDVVIAEKVMNWSRITPNGKVSKVNYFGWHSWSGGEPRYQYITKIKNFNPSTNMDHAWKVINQLNGRGYKVEVTQTYSRSFCTIYDSSYAIAEVDAEPYNPAYAICLAALEALEIKVS